jgi:uncharacterized membrane protein YczE
MRRDGEKEPGRVAEPRVFERLGPIPPAVVYVWLFFLAVALALVGAAVAYELTAALLSVPVGLALGLSVAFLLGRDFVRWQVSWLSVVATLLFGALFTVAYW